MAAFIAKLVLEKVMEKKAQGKAKRGSQSSGPPSPDMSETSSKEGKSAAGADYAVGQSFKRGGKVKRTGLAKVHAGEVVLTKRQAAKRTRGKRE